MELSITIAGNIIVDYVKVIDNYPEKLSLVPVRDVKMYTGGLVPNVGIGLAKLDPKLDVRLLGYVGADADGEYALGRLKKYPNLDLGMIKVAGKTSFTDAMTINGTGERTFFTYTGANGLLTPDDFDFDKIGGFLHVGYILLLPGMDEPDDECGTKMARLLRDAKAAGIKTSIDVVSEDSARFCQKVPPALRYTDYCTINEFEAERTTGVKLRDGAGRLKEESMADALWALRKAGVSEWLTIHCPEGAFGSDSDDNFAYAPSEKFPPGYIKSSTGAGDAFAAGILYAALKGMDYGYALRFANAVAGMSLNDFEATDGIRPAGEVDEYLRIKN